MEPWRALQIEPAAAFEEVRAEACSGRLSHGRLDVPALRVDRRVAWTRDGASTYAVDVNPDALVAIKWPGWWRWLDHVDGGRRIVTVRHPAEVVASFAATGGRLAAGLEYDVPLHRDMNQRLLQEFADPRRRRVALYDRIAEALSLHSAREDTFVVRYEDWFSRSEALLEELGAFLGVSLASVVDIEPGRPPDESTLADVAAYCRNAAAVGYDATDVPLR